MLEHAGGSLDEVTYRYICGELSAWSRPDKS